MQKKQNEKLNAVILSNENWVLFEKQISEKDALRELQGLSHEKIKELLQDTLKQKKFEPFLKEQRAAYIRLRARKIITDKNIESYLETKIECHKKSIDKFLKKERHSDSLDAALDSLQILMNAAYGYVKRKTISPDFFENFRLKQDTAFNNYNLSRLKYLAGIDSSKISDLNWARSFYADLVSLYNNKKKSFFINYNMLALIQLHGKGMNVSIEEDQQDDYLYELRKFAIDSFQLSVSEKLQINFWFEVCRKTYVDTPKGKQELYLKCLTAIHAFFLSKKISLEEKNKICYYYIYHSRLDWATELLLPDYYDKIDNPEGLILLSKVLYENYEESRDTLYFDFLKEIYNRIGEKKWCPMFVGPCNISFQVLDYEAFRNFYCEKCKDYLNYAKAPQTHEE